MNNIKINGVKTYCFSSRQEVIEMAFAEKKSLLALNAEKILHANDRTRDLFSKGIGFTDGIGAVWALRRKGFRNAVKIPGCELWLDIISASYSDRSFYLVGSKQEVIEQAVEKLRGEFPGIRILNYRNGYIKDEPEKHALLNDLKSKKPDVVFVAMGSPRQEELISEMLEVHRAVYLGLGGSMDVYTGTVKRAPAWLVRNNLEWAYRLVTQPSRIKRQIFLVKFMWMLLSGKI